MRLRQGRARDAGVTVSVRSRSTSSALRQAAAAPAEQQDEEPPKQIGLIA
jgi:hypothetical protein